MKINDVLETINSILEAERTKRGLHLRGHFVSVVDVQKAMGPYKKYHISVIYVDIDNKENIDFVSKYYTHKSPKGTEEKTRILVEVEVLEPFFTNIINNWENIVKGIWK